MSLNVLKGIHQTFACFSMSQPWNKLKQTKTYSFKVTLTQYNVIWDSMSKVFYLSPLLLEN